MKALFLLLAENANSTVVTLLSSCLVYCGSLMVNDMKEMHLTTVIILKLFLVLLLYYYSMEVCNVQGKKV